MRESTVDRKLNNTFEIDSVEVEEVNAVVDVVPENDYEHDREIDYDSSRKNFYELVEKGKEAIEGIMVVAKETEVPRAYEVVGQLIKTVSETNQQLMDLHKKKEDIDKIDRKLGNTNIENALFVGSTAELQKLLKDKKRGN